MILNLFGEWFRRPRACGRTELIRFGRDVIDVDQPFAGVLALGGTGSGKSSSMDSVMLSLFRHGFGAVIAGVKEGEFDRVLPLAREANRQHDLVRVTADSPFYLGVLNRQLTRRGGSVETAAQMIDKLIRVAGKADGEGREGESFFVLATQRLVRMALHTVFLASGGATFEDLFRCVMTAPKSPAEAKAKELAVTSFCGQLLVRIEAKTRTPAEDTLYDRLLEYWLDEWPNLADRTRSGVEAGATNVWSRFIDPPFADLLGDRGTTPLTPEDVTERGKIVVLDLPILTWGLPAKLAQFAFILLVQEACLRRSSGVGKPVFIWRDECQHLIQASHDLFITTVARSHRLAHVDIVQDMDVLISALGGGDKARVEAEAFVAQHTLKYCFANSNPATNEFLSRLFGQRLEVMYSGGTDRNPDAGLLDTLLGSDRSPTVSWSTQYQPAVQPGFFSSGRLRTGGERNQGFVDAVMHAGGRRFSNGRSFRVVTFRQRGFDAT